jgi:hypothetical protein
MPKEFSEFTYGFAVSFELMSRYNSAIASGRIPQLNKVLFADIPNLREERWLGYDVLFPFPEAAPICFQYKVSELLSARRRKSVLTKKLSVLAGQLVDPAYTFEIRRDQNEQLHQLANNILVKAFYCVPKFSRVGELQRHVQTQTLLRNSFLLPPPVVNAGPRKQKHDIYFDLNNHRYVCSDPQKLDHFYEFEYLDEIVSARQNTNELLESLMARLRALHGRRNELWDRLEESQGLMGTIDDRYIRALWHYRWVKTLIGIYYGADFQLV